MPIERGTWVVRYMPENGDPISGVGSSLAVAIENLRREVDAEQSRALQRAELLRDVIGTDAD